MTFSFLKKKPEIKRLDKKTILTISILLTYLISVMMVVIELNSSGIRVDKFHRDIIGRCIEKNWEVSLYKDGQLESCHIPRTIE